METQNYIEYELIEPVTNRRLITESREEAIAYFERGWLVYEHHNTVAVPSAYLSTQQIISLSWNNKPGFKVQYD